MRIIKLEGGLKGFASRATSRFVLSLLLFSMLALIMILYTPKQRALALISPIHPDTTTVRSGSAHVILYENSTYGISLQYPSNWQKMETGETKKENINYDYDKTIVEFKLPSAIGENSEDRGHQGRFLILIHEIPPQNMIGKLISSVDIAGSQKISLEAFVLSHLTSLLTRLPDFHLIKSESGETTLNDSTPAHKLVYLYTDRREKGSSVMKDMEILAVKDDKGYIVRYLAQEPKFFDYLSYIQDIVKSFRITK
jgi:PsbP-like protein